MPRLLREGNMIVHIFYTQDQTHCGVHPGPDAPSSWGLLYDGRHPGQGNEWCPECQDRFALCELGNTDLEEPEESWDGLDKLLKLLK